MNIANPENARLGLKLQTPKNIGIVLCLLIPLVIVFAQFPFSLLLIAALAGILYYVFFYVLEGRPIGIQCPGCKKIIASNTPWECGFCHHINEDVETFHFLHQCEGCKGEPKAYKCHHDKCGELNFFSADRDPNNYAKCRNAPTPPPPPDPRQVKIKTEQELKEDRRNEIEIAKLDVELNAIREKAAKPKTRREQKMAIFDERYDASMGMKEHTRKRETEARQMFQNDPELLQDALDAIRDARDGML